MNIPKLIDYICLKYYYITNDVWDPKLISKAITLTENTITIGPGCTLSGTTSFLFEIITFGAFSWKFKFEENFKGFASRFGVICVDNDDMELNKGIDKNCFLRQDYSKFCFGMQAMDITDVIPNKNRFIKGDILTMTLDLNKNELQYKVNDIHINDSSLTIQIQPGNYRACVNLYETGDTITLLNS